MFVPALPCLCKGKSRVPDPKFFITDRNSDPRMENKKISDPDPGIHLITDLDLDPNPNPDPDTTFELCTFRKKGIQICQNLSYLGHNGFALSILGS